MDPTISNTLDNLIKFQSVAALAPVDSVLVLITVVLAPCFYLLVKQVTGLSNLSSITLLPSKMIHTYLSCVETLE